MQLMRISRGWVVTIVLLAALAGLVLLAGVILLVLLLVGAPLSEAVPELDGALGLALAGLNGSLRSWCAATDGLLVAALEMRQ
jgi:hypothetical protein